MIISSGCTNSAADVAAVLVACTLNDFGGEKSIVVLDDEAIVENLVVAGAALLTPQYVSEVLHERGSSSSMTAASAAAVLDFLFKDYPSSAPSLDGLQCLPGAAAALPAAAASLFISRTVSSLHYVLRGLDTWRQRDERAAQPPGCPSCPM
jgi:hypothetical protein